MKPVPVAPGTAIATAVALVALTAVACSGGDDEGATAPTTASSTTASSLTFDERDAALQLNIAATGLNLVASDVGLRTARGEGAEYCRTAAPGELEPHRSALAASADADVRRLAEAAVTDLQRAVSLCADGAAPSAVQEAIRSYNASFERLRRRIDALLGPGG